MIQHPTLIHTNGTFKRGLLPLLSKGVIYLTLFYRESTKDQVKFLIYSAISIHSLSKKKKKKGGSNHGFKKGVGENYEYA